jgi:hypothetical protein
MTVVCLQIISLSNQLEDMAASNLGEVVIFKWVEFLREHAPSVSFDGDAVQQDIAEENAEESTDLDSCEYITHDAEWAPADHQHLASPEIHEKWSACIVSGDILVDRKSTFQAHLAPVRSVADVSDLLTVLKSNNKIARATHNIMAYRIVHKEGVHQFACAFAFKPGIQPVVQHSCTQELSLQTATTTGSLPPAAGCCTSSPSWTSRTCASSSRGAPCACWAVSAERRCRPA